MKKGKSANALMKHIRTNHKIYIAGSNDKNKLLEMGYYHGYKSYRYRQNSKRSSNSLNLTNFKQVTVLYELDNKLKQILYPVVMKLETSLKNLVLDIIVSESSPYMNDVYVEHLNRHKILAKNLFHTTAKGNNLKRLRKEKTECEKNFLILKSEISKQISFNYNREVVLHYLQNGEDFPVWAVFELLMLGSFGDFIGQLNFEDESKIITRLGLNEPRNIDSNIALLQGYIYLIKDLRNAVAHNSVVFDTRFKKSLPSKSIKSQLKYIFNLNNDPDFESIIDYIIVLVFFMNRLHYNKNYIRKFVLEINQCLAKVSTTLPINTVNEIFPNWEKYIEKVNKKI